MNIDIYHRLYHRLQMINNRQDFPMNQFFSQGAGILIEQVRGTSVTSSESDS